ncbi:MAG TPA: gephyrin-like molybdotransferase Glp [Geminicoccaceae bacterium]|nr:gephyrin-like molybdotransferase Glp [Geminicoccaceae bacterium]
MVRALIDDCFAHHPKRLTAAQALDLLRTRIRPVVGRESVALAAAHGRILAEEVASPRDVPAFDNVAVDGFAFAHADLAGDGPTRLALMPGRAAAGHPFAGRLLPGAALRVLTGAPMPAGADTALMQEDVEVHGDAVVIPPGVKRGANRRRAGEDVQTGQVALRPGIRLRPQDVGVAAALGCDTLEVFRPLRVALFSTGDELREPGTPLRPGETYDANRPMLLGLLQALGCRVIDFGILPDRADAVAEALSRASAECDALITSGGASRGDEDHVVQAVDRIGQLHFWQIAVKPGRPLAFGRLGRAVFVGLPGNPVAAVVCFLRFARPLLIALGGGSWPEPRAFLVPADFAMRKKPDRREYLRARLIPGPDGRIWAQRIEREGSGILTSLTEADGLVEVAEEVTQIERGDAVEFVPFSELGVPP